MNNNKIFEVLGILQEECAEVIVEVSKCRRFGLNSTHYKTGILHLKMLENEIGDILAMIDILKEYNVVSEEGLSIAVSNKKDKLKKWSKIFD